jgi:DMSO/TMAO reductase YedYZ molybdopterin-dependent catalytic subunit
MSFLNNLIKGPKYQTTDPRKPEEIADPDVVISPDTRRDNRMPPGQSRTKKWPVLDAHGTPDVDLATWSFEVDGLVEHPQQWSLDEFMQLAAVRVYADFHCVTRWSRLDNLWGGVPTRELAKIVGVKPEANLCLRLATTLAGPPTFRSNTSSMKTRCLRGRMTALQFRRNTAARFA